jgi:uncharacterized protein (TIGR02246 family)
MPPSNKTADKKAIRALDQQWGEAATRNDLDAVVDMYARDGSLVWPDNPPYHGSEEIRKQWREMFKLYPEIQLKFAPDKIDISESGDLAVDFGVVDFQFTSPEGVQRQVGKYVVVWKKVRGAWKVYYDSWNGNEAAPAAETNGGSNKPSKSRKS